MRSLPNYLNRIGLKHAPLKADLSTLALVMAAHSRAIAFENIDVMRGKTISMARGDVEKKLVDDLRGGYCWEQNTLLSMALEEIGFDVVPLLCRVRWNKVAAQRAPKGPRPDPTLSLSLTVALAASRPTTRRSRIRPSRTSHSRYRPTQGRTWRTLASPGQTAWLR